MGALGGIERALEEGAKDGRLDVGPVVMSGRFEDAEIAMVERDRLVVAEEAAVEVRDGGGAEEAVGLAHGLEEVGQHAVEVDGGVAVVGDHSPKGIVWEQPDGVGEEAEDESHEEVRDLFLAGRDGGKGALQLEPLCQVEEVGGGCAGDRNCDDFRAELVVVAKDVAKNFQGRKGAGGGVLVDKEVVEGECEFARRGVLELGVHDETNEVADDEDGRILKAFVVLIELLVGLIEVSASGFVFPCEEASPPNVSEADIVRSGLGDPLFIGVTRSDVVILRGMRDAEDFTKIAKVGLGARFFGQVAGVPLADEVLQICWHGLKLF